MVKVINNDTGMNIVGQGAKIMLFAVPGALGAAAIHLFAPRIGRGDFH